MSKVTAKFVRVMTRIAAVCLIGMNVMLLINTTKEDK